MPTTPVRYWSAPFPTSHSFLSYGDFVLFPSCWVLLALATRRVPQGFKYIETLAVALPWMSVSVILVAGKDLLSPRWTALSLFTLAGSLLLWLPSKFGLALMARVGAFSYALYAIHMPLLGLASSLTGSNGSLAASVLGLLCGVVASLALASVLELRFQPWVSRAIRDRVAA